MKATFTAYAIIGVRGRGGLKFLNLRVVPKSVASLVWLSPDFREAYFLNYVQDYEIIFVFLLWRIIRKSPFQKRLQCDRIYYTAYRRSEV